MVDLEMELCSIKNAVVVEKLVIPEFVSIYGFSKKQLGLLRCHSVFLGN